MTRLAELAGNLAAVRERIRAAAASAGRDPSAVTLVAVSKTWPPYDVMLLHRIGVDDFAENYDREAAAKAAQLRDAAITPRWHFVGRIQRNKCRSIATYADVVHSIDRAEAVDALAAGARHAGRTVTGLVQVSYDRDPARGGCAPEHVPALAARIARAGGLRFGGMMTVPPLGVDPRPCFARLRALAESLRHDHVDATVVSAGMSADFEAAIEEGATHVRVGTALFGERAATVR